MGGFIRIQISIGQKESWESQLFTEDNIINRIPKVLAWAKATRKIRNQYLWGGTIGPNFDCSGFVQSAFASSGIWIPRDAYQQEIFCENVALNIEYLSENTISFALAGIGTLLKSFIVLFPPHITLALQIDE